MKYKIQIPNSKYKTLNRKVQTKIQNTNYELGVESTLPLSFTGSEQL